MSEYIYATDGEVVQNMLSEVFEPLQEIVRCRDCEQRESDYCHWIDRFIKPDGFCAWGEHE